MPGVTIRVASLPVGASVSGIPEGVGIARSGSIVSHVTWRFGESVGALAQAIGGTSIMTAGSHVDVLQFHDETATSPNSCLERINRAGSTDRLGLDQLVRKLKPSGVAINFSISAGLATTLRQATTQAAWETYLRGLASRVRGTITVSQAANRVVTIRCPVPPF